jgi:hypothetical protein
LEPLHSWLSVLIGFGGDLIRHPAISLREEKVRKCEYSMVIFAKILKKMYAWEILRRRLILEASLVHFQRFVLDFERA